MRRSLIVLLITILIEASSFSAFAAQDRKSNPPKRQASSEIVKTFRELSTLKGRELEHCAELMRNSLNKLDFALDTDTRRSIYGNAYRIMRERKCFDDYSDFIDTVEWSASRNSARVVSAIVPPRAWILDRVLIVRIPIFVDRNFPAETVASNLMAQLYELHAPNSADSILLDLRNNPGGFLGSLRDVLELFSPQLGIRFMKITSKPSSGLSRYEITHSRGMIAHMPIDILIDANTASASEWMAATLRNEWYREATRIIGAGPSYGKVLIQSTERVGDIFLKVTSGRWSVDGRDQNATALRPDVLLDVEPCKHDYRCIIKLIAQQKQTKF